VEESNPRFTVVEWLIITEVYAKEGIEQAEVIRFLSKDYGCCILRVLASLSQLVEKNCLTTKTEKAEGKTRLHYYLTLRVAQIFCNQSLYL
jgi:predicted transcriptional regulator